MRVRERGSLRVVMAALMSLLCGGAETEKPGWKLTFHDEFDGTALDRDRWAERFTVVPSYFVFQDGIIHLRMDRDAPVHRPNIKQRISGIETRRAGKPFAQQYGWFEIRARCALGSGLGCSFWLSPM